MKIAESTLAAQTIAFMQELTECVNALPGVCLVVTLPSSILNITTSRRSAITSSCRRSPAGSRRFTPPSRRMKSRRSSADGSSAASTRAPQRKPSPGSSITRKKGHPSGRHSAKRLPRPLRGRLPLSARGRRCPVPPLGKFPHLPADAGRPAVAVAGNP